jgi:CHAT domain-containing protein
MHSLAQNEELKFKIGVRQPTPDEQAEYERLQSEYKSASAALINVLEDVPAEFSKPRDDHDNVPRDTEIAQMQEAIRQVSAATGKQAVAIYTLSTEKQLRLFLITPDEIKTFSSPVRGDDLSNTVLKFYAVLQSPGFDPQSPGYDPRPLGKRLYDAILKPVEPELKKRNVQTILRGLDGNLRYVPMSALSPDGETYLVERYQSVLFMRWDPEALTRATSPVWTGTGFGSSRPHVVDLVGEGTQTSFAGLPGVLTELEGIFGRPPAKGILAGPVFTDDRFTKSAFYGALRARRPVMHISGHFSFRPGDSSHSFLILGDGQIPFWNYKLAGRYWKHKIAGAAKLCFQSQKPTHFVGSRIN